MGHYELCFFAIEFLFIVFGHTEAVSGWNSDRLHPDFIFGSTTYNEGESLEAALHWRSSAIAELSKKLKEHQRIGKAKNVILFLGDGWDVQTLTAARILKGQQVDMSAFGEESKLHLETFPASGYSKTYCADFQVGESACAATAYLGGVKGNAGTIGVTSDVPWNNCTAQRNAKHHVSSILAWAQASGKSTGIVTTTSITDASPAGTYAHTSNRLWQSDKDVQESGEDSGICDDIAEQLILKEPGRNIDVIMGGGRRKFYPENKQDSEDFSGERKDNKNLVQLWKTFKVGMGKPDAKATFVESRSELMSLNTSLTDALLGLFSPEDLAYYHDQEEHDDPGLPLMTEKAIEILKRNPKGFFLFVEGGLIDHAHHNNFGLRSLWETIEFDRAIQKGDEMTNDEDTLIVVTADHGHTMSFAGYTPRGSKINGIGGIGSDKLPYSTLNYANGPGYKGFKDERRYDISKDNNDDLTNQKVPLVPLKSATHGGHDVPIFAKGPFAHLLNGVHEQNYIPYVMAYASCIGQGPTFCKP